MRRRNTARKGIRLAGNSAWTVGKFAFRTTGTLFNHLFRWSTTDHLGIAKSLNNMPRMGFLDSLGYIAGTLFAGLVGALVGGLTAFLLIAYGIPLVIHFLFFM
jgi:hypothetical protein